MAKCKICDRPVLAGPVMHSDCLEQLITEAAEQLCDDYCIWPDLCGSQEQLHREHCGSCPMEIEYGGSKVDLRTCLFCGSAPMIHDYRNRMRQWYRIKCSNETEDCRMVPETTPHLELIGATADWNQRGTRGTALEEIWQQLSDVPMDPETECLEAPFCDWPAGTHREEIWHWFDEHHSKGVAYLLYGEGA